MKIGNKQIDHLVYCVDNLDEGIKHLESLLGVTAIKGGKHKTKGTHNALINLGQKCYLEILAIDPESQIESPRWMGIDYLGESKITRWAINSNSIIKEAKILKVYNEALSIIDQGQRVTTTDKLLKWQMTKPLASPEVELMPFLIDWSQSEMHPTDNLPEQCRLVDLKLSGPQDLLITSSLQQLLDTQDLVIDISAEITLRATISSPNGEVVL